MNTWSKSWDSTKSSKIRSNHRKLRWRNWLKKSIMWQMNVSKKIKSYQSMNSYTNNLNPWRHMLMNRITKLINWKRNWKKLMNIQSKRNTKKILIRKIIIMKKSMKKWSTLLQSNLKKLRIYLNKKRTWNESCLRIDDFDLSLLRLKTVRSATRWSDKLIDWTKRSNSRKLHLIWRTGFKRNKDWKLLLKSEGNLKDDNLIKNLINSLKPRLMHLVRFLLRRLEERMLLWVMTIHVQNHQHLEDLLPQSKWIQKDLLSFH